MKQFNNKSKSLEYWLGQSAAESVKKIEFYAQINYVTAQNLFNKLDKNDHSRKIFIIVL